MFQSEPQPVEKCPFCNQPSDVIYKIYNSKTKHYSAFSIGQGDYSATFTCRNCTTEGALSKDYERSLIQDYKLSLSFDKICELRKHNPVKARGKLEKLIQNNQKHSYVDHFAETLRDWDQQLQSP